MVGKPTRQLFSGDLQSFAVNLRRLPLVPAGVAVFAIGLRLRFLSAAQVVLNEPADVQWTISNKGASFDIGASLSQTPVSSYRGYATVPDACILELIEKRFERFLCCA
jgi:hypothetical protein